MLGEDAKVEERLTGAELVGRFGTYEGPIFACRPRAERYPILADDFVTTEDGTGIVHLAPAFGEDDYRVAAAARAVRPRRSPRRCYNPVRPDGTYDERVLGRGRHLLRGPLRQGRRG